MKKFDFKKAKDGDVVGKIEDYELRHRWENLMFSEGGVETMTRHLTGLSGELREKRNELWEETCKYFGISEEERKKNILKINMATGEVKLNRKIKI